MQQYKTVLLSLTGLVAVIVVVAFARQQITGNIFMDPTLIDHDKKLPPLWLYYDDSETNSRWWLDFGARNARNALNLPFLNLSYQTIVAQNSADYRIEVIYGLTGVAELLGGWQNMPRTLQSAIRSVNQAELTWIRAAILAKFGGLWLDSTSICIRPFGKLPDDRIVFFGTDLDETYGGDAGTQIPGMRAIWSPKAGEGFFIEWEQISRSRLDKQAGGLQARGDYKWDWVALSSKYGCHVDGGAEGARKEDGRRVQLEDLLASGLGGQLSWKVGEQVKYIPVMWPELRDREMFGWFLRMSVDQIMESDLSVRYLYQKGLIVPVQQSSS